MSIIKDYMHISFGFLLVTNFIKFIL